MFWHATREVVLLPTKNENSPITINPFGKLKLNIKDKIPLTVEGLPEWSYRDLYIISDETAQNGDWIIDVRPLHYGHIVKCAGYSSSEDIHDGLWYKGENGILYNTDQCMKIIATTNPLLKLPKIPNSFILKYVESGIIESVIVEYEESDTIKLFSPFKVRVDANNVILLDEKKILWTREEVIELFYKFKEECVKKHQARITNMYLTDWLEKNL